MDDHSRDSLPDRAGEKPTQNVYDALLRKDVHAFAQKAFNTLHPNGGLKSNWHIDAISAALEDTISGKTKRLIINLPPRSLKSELASVILPAFLLGRNPSERIVCVSYAQPLSAKLSRLCSNILKADWYQRIFPGTRLSKDTEEMIETTRGGARVATSVGGSVTGLGGNFIIIDDPMKPDEAASSAALEKVVRYYREVLSTRLDDKLSGVIILVMQRVHEDDLAGVLLRQPNWHHLCLPAIGTRDDAIPIGGGRTHLRRVGDLLHPDREPGWALDEARLNLGSAAFEAQYQQSPVPAEGAVIKFAWLKRFDLASAPQGRVVQSWDTALKGDPGRDYSVCTTWREAAGKQFLVDIYRERLDFPDLVKAAVRLHAEHQPHGLLIEDEGSGTSLSQDLRARLGIFAITRRPKTDKETRLATVAPMFESGQVFVPHEAPWLAEFIRELCGFPNVKHDDQVDSVTQYLLWRRDQEREVFTVDWGDEPLEAPWRHHGPRW